MLQTRRDQHCQQPVRMAADPRQRRQPHLTALPSAPHRDRRRREPEITLREPARVIRGCGLAGSGPAKLGMQRLAIVRTVSSLALEVYDRAGPRAAVESGGLLGRQLRLA